MSTLSKLFGGTLGFRLMTASCYEFGHTWNPNCYLALTDALGDALLFCFKTYGLLYLVNSAVRSGGNPRKIKWGQLLKNTLRSSLFLTTNLVLLIFFICRMRQILGFTIWPTISFVSSFTASLISIFIEAKKRRMMLALYLSNLASESVFRQLLNRGKVREVHGAQAIIFSVGLAIIFQLLAINSRQKHDNETTPMASAEGSKNSLVVTTGALAETSRTGGADDAFMRSFINMTHFNSRISPEQRRAAATKFLLDSVRCVPKRLRKYLISENTLNSLRTNMNYLNECSINLIFGVQHSARNFLVAAVFSVLLTFLRNARKPLKFFQILRRPSILLRMPLFFGLMPLLYQLANCLLQQVPVGALRSISPAICGAVSGLAMLAWPNTNISMYVLWKGIEMSYRRLAGMSSLVPTWKHGDALLYGIASGYVVGLAVIEPHAIRGSYYKFLAGLTNDKIKLFNRELIGRYFGFDSNRLYIGKVPLLDGRFAMVNPQLYQASHVTRTLNVTD